MKRIQFVGTLILFLILTPASFATHSIGDPASALEAGRALFCKSQIKFVDPGMR